jgi:hypothetical protein
MADGGGSEEAFGSGRNGGGEEGFLRMLIFGGADEGDDGNGTYEVSSDIHVLRIPFAALDAIVTGQAGAVAGLSASQLSVQDEAAAIGGVESFGEEQQGNEQRNEELSPANAGTTTSEEGGAAADTQVGSDASPHARATCRMRWERPRTWLVDVAELHAPVALEPPKLHEHMGRLLQSGEFSDVSLRIGSEEAQEAQEVQEGGASIVTEPTAVVEAVGTTSPQEALKACKVHKVILALRSPRLHALFTNGMAESSQPIVRIDEEEPEAFMALLRYLYTGTLAGLEAERLTGLLVLARAHLVDDLATLCQGGLLHLLSLDATNAVSAQLNCCCSHLSAPPPLPQLLLLTYASPCTYAGHASSLR